MRIWQYCSLSMNGLGGVEKHVESVSQALRGLGCEIAIGTTLPESWFNDASKPVIVHTHGDLVPAARVAFKVRHRPWMRWIQVCHGTTVGRVLACREIPKLSATRGTLRDFLGTAYSHGLIAVSQTALNEAKRFFFFRGNSTIIPNAADVKVFAPLPEVTKEPHLVFVGRSEDGVKNTRALLEACEEISKTNERLRLFAAPGIHAKGPQKKFVVNLGPQTNVQLAALFKNCRALVLCSFYEGDPLVLHEAKASGLPVAASALPQLRESLVNYENAFFFDPRNQVEMRQVLSKIVDPGLELRPAPQPRSWETVASRFLDFYQGLYVQ
ncbi:MAG: glycosyltransferase family 4 protein [Bdellovibrionota bacterium]